MRKLNLKVLERRVVPRRIYHMRQEWDVKIDYVSLLTTLAQV